MDTLEQDVAVPLRATGEPSTTATGSNSLIRFWMPAALLLAVFAFSVPTIPSADMWWHLSTGRYILQNHSIPHTDPFSATAGGKPWIAHEWLADILFYGAYSALGSAGLLLLTAVVLTLAFCFAYARLGGNQVARIIALGLGVWAASPVFSVRPQIFTYAFAAIFLFVLTRYFENGSWKPLVVLPVLVVLWVDLHGGYILGPALILLFAVGAVADWLGGNTDARTTGRRVLTLVAACAVCLAVVPLNPNGLAMYSYPFETLSSGGMQAGIMEWRSPDFHLSIFHPMALLLFLTVAVLALSPKRPKPSQIVLFVFFAFASLYSMRNLPFFVLVSFPLLAEYASLPAWKLPAFSPVLQNVLKLAVVVAIAVISAKVVSDHVATELEFEQSRFPARAASFLDAQKLPAPLLNSYDFGGYLIWRLYPQYRVYIDGRADLYGDAFLDKFIQLYDVNIDPRPALEQEGIRTVLVEPRSNLANFLRTQTNWKRVYEDPVAVVFSR
jgi:hypothetical protein